MMYTFNDHVQQNVLSGIHRAKDFDMYHDLNHYIHLNVLFHYFLSYSLIFCILVAVEEEEGVVMAEGSTIVSCSSENH